MGILDKIGDFLSGGVFTEITTLAKEYFPPDMSDQQKAEFEIRASEISHKREMEANKLMLDAENAITERVVTLEGSAQDLRAIPFVGPLMIFLRGLQRPIWGYMTLYMDVMWFSGKWELGEQQEACMWVVNFLILGFLFGERAVQNLAPLISDIVNKSSKK